jgi:hypothetical protein
MKNLHIIPENREPVRGDILLRHLWKNDPKECISWWRYKETVDIDGVKQYTTLNGSFTDIISSFKVQNIYIIANGSFVRGAYVTDGIEVIRATPKLVNAQGLVDRRNWKKIILTSDPKLIADGIQAIDEDFLEWFVKNPSCEEVEVEKVKIINYAFPRSVYDKYKILIPKEELCPLCNNNKLIDGVCKECTELLCKPFSVLENQETLEDVAKRKHRELSTATIGIIPNFVDGFLEGYKEAEGRSYSEGEVKSFLNSIISEINSRKENIETNQDKMPVHLLEGGLMAFEASIDAIKELFDEFKKK